MSSNTYSFSNMIEEITLQPGKYKLEVWGAKGGDSTGQSTRNQASVQGGLGGYASGIINLTKEEKLYIYVGSEGKSANQSDGSLTKGGFPDGGDVKTFHCGNYTTVPGTGGGSTSIRIGDSSDYSRVIVAGGGGGASGSSCHSDPGGFGGGPTGGNCYKNSSQQSQGAGSQYGSTPGCGGNPGMFGRGASGNYSQNKDSGGGGGGGWYGGGSGGYGDSNSPASSGGGGSGWVFNESSLRAWNERDSKMSTRFNLNNSYYLTETRCAGGNEEFPKPKGGTERGHSGNGYALITRL